MTGNISFYVNKASFVLQREKVASLHPNAIFSILLLLSGDVEKYPGPCQRELPELTTLLKNRGMYLLH